MLRKICEWFAARLRNRLIPTRERTAIYLERYYLLGGPRDNPETSKRPINPFLHHFRRSDDAEHLHCHPWKWGLAIILVGGYSEERRAPARGHEKPCATCAAGKSASCYKVTRRVYKPLSFNFLRGTDYHRVDLLGEDCWTLFIAGPKRKEDWSFWDRHTGTVTQWEKFLGLEN